MAFLLYDIKFDLLFIVNGVLPLISIPITKLVSVEVLDIVRYKKKTISLIPKHV